ncbi:MAG: flagellar biosynthesis protein FlhF [Clostridiaceae bacterium]|jgi:flagellar biosynthesis protein FlhF|nr:flagellar biosynthesis protein FlhF [Clostridiaceae bacterium]
MKIRRYTCKDMQEAMQKVKLDLGSEAVIISSKKVKPKGLFGFLKKPLIEVLAAVDDDRVPVKRNYYQRQEKQAPSFPQYQPQSQPPQSQQPQQPPQQQVPQQQVPTTQEQVLPQVQYQNMSQQPVQPQQQYQQMGSAQQATMPHVPVPPSQAAQTYLQNHGLPSTTSYNGQASNDSKVINEVAASTQADTNAENTKLSELEDKVRNLEITLEKVYQAVSGNGTVEKTEVEESEPVKNENSITKEDINNTEGFESIEEGDFFEDTTPSEDNIAFLRRLLFERDVEPKLIEKILEKIKQRGGNGMKKEEMLLLSSKIMTLLLGEPEPINLEGQKKPHVVIFLGPTGVGKTTTLAKLAADFTFKNKKVGLITADTYRIAAVEQLKTYAEILNLQVTVVYSPNEIKDAINQLSDMDIILIDTAGRSHKNKSHFDELKTLVSAVEADETYLVINCNTSRIALREILEYYAFVKDYKLLFTKLDESPVCGIILNARYMTGKPISYTTNGQSVPDDMSVANVKQIVADVLSERDL